MITQNETILTQLIELKQREMQAAAAAERLARSARQERPPRIRIGGRLGGWLRRAYPRVNLPHFR